jgi:hypothetical protein
MNRGGGLFGGMARKVAGSLAGGVGNMLGGGNSLGMLGSGSAIDQSDEEPNGSNGSSRSLRKKKRHKKRR